ncbi:MAG: NUDIX domain-containing protein [Egibacteraceae bacterium]
MASYIVASSHVVHDGVFSRVRVDEVWMPDGRLARREIVEQTRAVAVVPLDDQGRVTLVRQYRHAIGERTLEVPAGKLDVEGEEPVAAARRELAEEARLAADRWEFLIEFHNSAGWTNESTLVYLATGLHETSPPDGFEAEHEETEIEIVCLPLDEAVAMIRRGELTDAKTVVGLLLTAMSTREGMVRP